MSVKPCNGLIDTNLLKHVVLQGSFWSYGKPWLDNASTSADS